MYEKNARIERMGTSLISVQFKKMKFGFFDMGDSRQLLWDSNTPFRKIELGGGIEAYTAKDTCTSPELR
jgi:serine/threonine protein phosphatase PrpC